MDIEQIAIGLNRAVIAHRGTPLSPIDISEFHGRIDELATLTAWAIDRDCRLVTMLGMGGIGKTSLSVKLCQQIQDRFEYVSIGAASDELVGDRS
jgi:ATP-dependent Lon protease